MKLTHLGRTGHRARRTAPSHRQGSRRTSILARSRFGGTPSCCWKAPARWRVRESDQIFLLPLFLFLSLSLYPPHPLSIARCIFLLPFPLPLSLFFSKSLPKYLNLFCLTPSPPFLSFSLCSPSRDAVKGLLAIRWPTINGHVDHEAAQTPDLPF